jgi:hypothetical protein
MSINGERQEIEELTTKEVIAELKKSSKYKQFPSYPFDKDDFIGASVWEFWQALRAWKETHRFDYILAPRSSRQIDALWVVKLNRAVSWQTWDVPALRTSSPIPATDDEGNILPATVTWQPYARRSFNLSEPVSPMASRSVRVEWTEDYPMLYPRTYAENPTSNIGEYAVCYWASYRMEHDAIDGKMVVHPRSYTSCPRVDRYYGSGWSEESAVEVGEYETQRTKTASEFLPKPKLEQPASEDWKRFKKPNLKRKCSDEQRKFWGRKQPADYQLPDKDGKLQWNVLRGATKEQIKALHQWYAWLQSQANKPLHTGQANVPLKYRRMQGKARAIALAYRAAKAGKRVERKAKRRIKSGCLTYAQWAVSLGLSGKGRPDWETQQGPSRDLNATGLAAIAGSR